MDFLLEVLKSYGIPGILGVALSVILLWVIAERVAKPGTEISVLWGLVKYIKKGGEEKPQKTIMSEGNGLHSSDIIPKIQTEANSLLSVVRGTPGGLWLAAEGVTAPQDSLLLSARQMKSEHRAEALAHLSLGLMTFNKPKVARAIAEQSLSAAADVPDSLQSFTYLKLAEKLTDANLAPLAQQAAEQALKKTQASKRVENFRHVTQIYARVFSPLKALTAARALQDPKSKSEALEAIISCHIEEGDGKEAAPIIEEALAVLQKIAKVSDRAHAYHARAREWMRIGRYKDAANVIKLAEKEAQQIRSEELFGDLAKKTIANDANFLQAHPLDVLRKAETQRNPYLLTYLGKFLPKRAQETIQIAKSAVDLAAQVRASDALAEAAQMLDEAGLHQEAQQAAQKAMDLAMAAADHRFRDAPLQKVAKIFSQNGDYENALFASAAISAPKYGAEETARALIACYARTGKINSKAASVIARLRSSCATLDDKDRSAAMMQLAVSAALLENLKEAYQITAQSPLSGHRISAYAIIMLVHQLQNLPPAETAKIHRSRGAMFEKMLLPILGWDVAN